MTKNTGLGGVFISAILTIALRKQLTGLVWKGLRLRSKEQIFNLLAKHRFLEITGASGVGKSGFLAHCFKHLQGVKFTNLPTPNNTLTKEILETHFIAKGDAPNKGYYLLDDINIWQKGAQQELGAKGYEVLKDYLTQVGKLGGTFVGTNNGIAPEHILQVQKNKTLIVSGHYQFLDRYSLLAVRTQENGYNFLPTIIAIDNQEMTEFYDPHWNIPKAMQENGLEYIFAQKLQAKEGMAILRSIKKSHLALSDEEGVKQFRFDRQLYLNYLKAKEQEEGIVRGNKKKFQALREKTDRYRDTAGRAITETDLEGWDKEDKDKKKTKSANSDQLNRSNSKGFKKDSAEKIIAESPKDNNSPLEPDLDQIHQDPNLLQGEDDGNLATDQINEPHDSGATNN